MAKKKRQVRKDYELPQGQILADKIVLGLDPGSANFGISAVGILDGSIQVFANSVLVRPVDDLINFVDSSNIFLKEINRWMIYQPDGIIAERFQTRGNGGPLIEQVSSMLGLIRGRYPKIPIKLTVASAWKNKLNRRFECDLKEIYPTVAVQPHQLDATLIGVYGLESGLDTNIDYDLEDIISQVENTSLIGLRKMKEPK